MNMLNAKPRTNEAVKTLNHHAHFAKDLVGGRARELGHLAHCLDGLE